MEVLPKRGMPGLYPPGSLKPGGRVPLWDGTIVFDADTHVLATEDGSCAIRRVGERSGGKERWVDMVYTVRGVEGTFALQSAGYVPGDEPTKRVVLLVDFYKPRLADDDDVALATMQIATLVSGQYLGAGKSKAYDDSYMTEMVSDAFSSVAFSELDGWVGDRLFKEAA